LWDRYRSGLEGWAAGRGVRLPVVPAHCEHPAHMFYLLFPSLAERQAVMDRLKARGILSVFHYLPLHLSEMGKRFGGREGQCPVAERVSDRILRLPFFTSMKADEQAEVIEAV